ncbi:phage major capsid protein, P2 family [Acinetobacter tandoii]|uniref:p2 family phage major capsid protein n=1 Tax=Acinetobacter tandoii DSM 14970 = CIP 107469 TaxID=1120927 RepID=R9AYD6_9GAMM|nr:phage major capsid protein, P2 family [Acinetobacter tandoii]EOR07203.1 P2 family phage major capsid protein [Acinetobacter tandoii DSM 14970 = CIP 107469]
MSVVLQPQARQLFSSYKADVARANGVESARETFAVLPAPTQKIIQAYQENADFLKLINIWPVDNAKGEKISLSIGTTIAGNTNTNQNPRQPTPVGTLDLLDEYDCTQTNYDVAMKWVLLNAWRHFPDFKKKLQEMVIRAVALDKLCIGFNGIYRAANSDRVANPLLQDVKKGWLQKIREIAPEQYYKGEDVGGGVFKTQVGAGHEFKTLDGLIEFGIEEYIAEQHRDSGLIAICGRGILSDKYLPLLNNVQDPTEQLAARTIYANKQLGTLPAMHVPKFPAKTILITTPDNLSIYIQNGTFNRSIVDQPEWDRAVDFQSINEDFVVEDYTKCLLIENIEVDA